MRTRNGILPHFQPIVCADWLHVEGYEVLGRVRTKAGIRSLGPFFHRSIADDAELLAVDTYLWEQAVERVLDAREQTSLFLNLNANSVLKGRSEHVLERLRSYEKRGLDPNRIVLEVTEHDYNGDISELREPLDVLRDMGVRIAIDDVGKGASNLDRIGILEPDILKVDLDSLKGEEETLAYYGVIHSLSLLARKIGAALLFEGLETREEVKFAWQNGARYYQGYYLSEPRGTFVDHALMKERFSRMVRQFIEEKKTVYHKECKKEEAIQQRVKEIFSAEAPAENLDQWLLTIGDRLNDICFRIYICNENGDQLTANAVCREGRWSLDPASRNKNWSWRPYFLQNSVKMGVDGQGILSDYYQDIEFKALIHTFSYPLDNKTFVFFDLMPDMDV